MTQPRIAAGKAEENALRLYNFAWGPYPRRLTIYLGEKRVTDLALVPEGCPKLDAWFSRFSDRESVVRPPYPPHILALAYGLPGQTGHPI